jgi:hypothetical protein
MAAADPPGAHTTERQRWTAGRPVSAVAGSLIAVVALAVLVGGTAFLAANRTMRDNGHLTGAGQRHSSVVAPTVPGRAGSAAREIPGTAPSAPPESAVGSERQSAGPGEPGPFLTPHTGRWSAALRNADGTGPVTASIDVGVSAPWLTWLGGLLVVAGIIVVVAAAVLVGVAVHRASR